jgi:LacI family transcriptional regulator
MMEIGSKAAQLLLSRIDGDKTAYPRIVRLKTELITEW